MLVRWAEGQQRSGRLGATIASHNRFGAYLRAGTVPVNPNTARQVAVRNAVRALTIAWQNTLTEAERGGWEWYASMIAWTNKFGDQVYLTGLNHYIRSNVQNVALGFGRIDVSPVIPNLATAELALGCTSSAATQQLTITFDDNETWATEVGSFQHFYVGAPQNSGIKFFGGPYKYIMSVAGITPAVSPLVGTSPWTIGDGQRIWLRSRIMRADGRLSEFAEINFLGAA